jgi:hypothetical protein
MTKKIALFILITIILTACGIKNNTSIVPQQKTENPEQIILYYGDTCPHCKIVEKYMLDNKVAEKLQIVQKEIFNNMENASEMADKASICKLDISKIGVPFLYYKSQCYMGDPDVIKFLESKIK